MEQKKYHDFLERQIEDRNAMTRIGQFEEQRQAKEVCLILCHQPYTPYLHNGISCF
jgi:hypothetical protein